MTEVNIHAEIGKINQKLAQILLEVSTLVKVISNGQIDTPQRENFDDEFDAATSSAIPDQQTSHTPDVERDKDGVPWDERIHAGTKTKTAKGIWKRKKGVDDGLFKSVMDEISTPPGVAPATAGSPPGVAPATAGSPPGVAPATAGSPPGSPPGVAPATAENADKKAAMESIAILTDEFGVDYSLVIGSLQFAFNVGNFNDLSEGQYMSAKNLFSSWVDKVRTADEYVERIVELGGDGGSAGVNQIYTNNQIGKLAEASHTVIDQVVADLDVFRNQWEEYAASQA